MGSRVFGDVRIAPLLEQDGGPREAVLRIALRPARIPGESANISGPGDLRRCNAPVRQSLGLTAEKLEFANACRA
jgi:hypothetical protein